MFATGPACALCRSSRALDAERGTALIVALLAGMLLSTLGLALLLTSNTETAIAANARRAQEAVYAADAAIERARHDLASIPAWTVVLAPGAIPECAQTLSAFSATACAGASDLVVTLPGTNQSVDLNAVTDALQARTDGQDLWGGNDPAWRLFAFGPMSGLLPAGAPASPIYIAVWVADDPSETDGDPSVDANGILTLHAEAYGPSNTKRVIDATIARPAPGHPGTKLLSWRLEP